MSYKEAPAEPVDGRVAEPRPRHLTATFPREPGEIAHARHTVTDALEAWGLTDHLQPLVLAVSEMVSNAVLHGDGQVEVALVADDACIRLEVWDDGGGQPEMRASDPTGEVPGGWGLHLVDEVADDWGAERVDGRTCVWLIRHRSDRA